jgi:hypothetical protein
MWQAWNRLWQALHFNETQLTWVILLTIINVAACIGREADGNGHWWIWVFVLTIYPALAIMGNLCLGGDKHEKEG